MVFVSETCLIMDMRIGGEKLEIHPFSCIKVLSHWRVIHCVKNPEKTVGY